MTQDTKWTEAQRRAIQTVGKTLLVSAGAGAGKTAVLTQRCLYLVADRKPPTELNRILVVTFTEAAAAEMRQRIGDALRERLESDESNAYLRRQLALLEQSPISTLHSFCLRLLREFFYELHLDPNCRVIEEDELLLLKEEIVTEVMEQFYAAEDEQGDHFRSLVDCYGGVSGDNQLRQALLNLHSFLQGVPDSESWLEETLRLYQGIGSRSTLDGLPWFSEFDRLFREELDALEQQARKVCSRQDIQSVPKYLRDATNLHKDFQAWCEFLSGNGVLETAKLIRSFKIPRKPSVPNAPEAASRALDALRERFKKGWLFSVSPYSMEDWLAGIARTQPHAQTLCEVYQAFRAALADAKKRAGCIDFSDMEHLCLRLLSDTSSVPGERHPSPVALSLRERFDHILVDEYQDINPVQDEILRLLSRESCRDSESNLFMVGDVKQSIYGFRLADPGLFVQKHRTFSDTDEGHQMKVFLRENFRSRENIINGVNALFRLLMTESLSDIRYDQSQELVCAAQYPDDDGLSAKSHPIEIHLLERKPLHRQEEDTPDGEPDEQTGKEENLEQADKEACVVAELIQEMIEPVEGTPLQVWDNRKKCYRGASYRDVVVLLRALKEKAERFADVLRRAGLPVYAEAGTGYLRATEIQDMLALLGVLDNPCQDIALSAALRSPIFRLQAGDLLRIRRIKEDGDFYSAVKHYAQQQSDSLAERLREILEQIDSWRTLARQRPLSSVIWELFQQTEYLSYVAGLPSGALRRANLLKLHNRSMQFDRFVRQGLARFLQFIERMEEVGADYGEAPYLSEAEDVVRVMSIHKSKGLEFPIVIVPDLGKAFNFSDERGDILFDRNLFMGLKAVELERMIKYPTLSHEIIGMRKHERTLAEEMRVLYVALTRAREKLILVGSVELEKTLGVWEQYRGEEDKGKLADALEDRFRRATRMTDWVGPAITVLSENSFPPAQESRTEVTMHCDIERSAFFRVFLYPSAVVEQMSVQGRMSRSPLISEDCIESLSPYQIEQSSDSVVAKNILQQVQWHYSHESQLQIPSKMSISEIKRRFDLQNNGSEEEETSHLQPVRLSRKPQFVEQSREEISSMERGLITHLVLQHLDLSIPLNEGAIRSQVKRMVEGELLTQEQAAEVLVKSLVQFFESDLGQRLQHSHNSVRREVPFSFAVPACSVIQDLPEQASSESILIQGIIDCLLEESDGFTLVDFKTDRVTEEQVPDRALKYQLQMAVYRRAVRQAFGKPVKETILYFLRPRVAHSVQANTESLDDSKLLLENLVSTAWYPPVQHAEPGREES